MCEKFFASYKFKQGNLLINKYQVSREYWSDQDFGFIIDDHGQFIALGENCWGQLGLGHNRQVDHEQIIGELFNKNVVAIYEGNCCILAQTAQGDVYSWGNNSVGQLGIGLKSDEDTFYRPTKVDFDGKAIIDIKCGSLHNIALSIDGVVFGWGDNQCRQITEDIREEHPYYLTPIQMWTSNMFPRIDAIYCYDNTSFMITSDSEVFYYGEDIWGAHENKPGEVEKLAELDYIPPIKLEFQAQSLICNDDCIYYIDHNFNIQQLSQWKNRKSTSLKSRPLNKVNQGKSTTVHSEGARWESGFGHWASLSTASLRVSKVKKPLVPVTSYKETEIVQDRPSDRYSMLMSLLDDIQNELCQRKMDFERKQGPFSGIIVGEFALNLSPSKQLWEAAHQLIEEDDLADFVYPEEIKIAKRLLLNKPKIYQGEKIQSPEAIEEMPTKIVSFKDFQEIKDIKFKQGTFGKVIAVREIATGKQFAIKRVWYPTIEELEQDLTEIREVRIMSKLNGARIVKFYRAWMEQEEFLHIQMELCEDNLGNILEIKPEAFQRDTGQPMSMVEYLLSWHMLREVTEALKILHTHQPKPIIHRNLKPSNILIVNNQIKLGDFGLAKEHDKSSHTSNQGSEKWMAPEVHQGRSYNLKADIYSLAVIALQIFGFELDKISDKKNRPIEKEKWLAWFAGHPEISYSQLEDKIVHDHIKSILGYLGHSCLLADHYSDRPDCHTFGQQMLKWIVDKDLVKCDLQYVRLHDNLGKYQNHFFIEFLHRIID